MNDLIECIGTNTCCPTAPPNEPQRYQLKLCLPFPEHEYILCMTECEFIPDFMFQIVVCGCIPIDTNANITQNTSRVLLERQGTQNYTYSMLRE